MKKILLLLLVIHSANSFSQAPAWAWFKNIHGSTGSSEDRGVSLTTDSSGNVFIIGHYGSPSITLGTTILSNTSLNNRDMYIAKYSPAGSLLWAKTFGGLYNDNPSSISTDSSGNLIVVGDFNSPSITFGSTTLTNSGMTDIFIVKFDTAGNVIWANKAGGTSEDICSSVKVNPSGEILLTGSYASPTCYFGANSLTNLGGGDVFIAKYNTSGSIIWTKRIGGTSYEKGNDITTDSNGNIFITGYFGSTSISDGVNSLTNTGINSMFLFKYDASGIFKWSKKWSGSSLDNGVGVATDNSGNVILAGNYGDTSINFDGIILDCMYTSSAIVKYDPNGNVIWAKTCSNGKYSVTSIAVDSQGSTYLSGYTICPAIFFGSMVVINSGSYDSVLMKYDPNGNELWGKIVGGSSDEFSMKTIVDQADNSYLLGSYLSSSINFDSTQLNNTGTGSNSNQIFFSKLTALLDTTTFGNQFSLTVSPNPVVSYSIINLNEELDNAELTLYDVSGKEIRKQIFSGKQLIFEKGNLVSGIYFIKIITNDGKSTTKKIAVK